MQYFNHEVFPSLAVCWADGSEPRRYEGDINSNNDSNSYNNSSSNNKLNKRAGRPIFNKNSRGLSSFMNFRYLMKIISYFFVR